MPKPDPIAADVDDRDDHVVADDDAFVALSGENQHISLARADCDPEHARSAIRCDARTPRPAKLPRTGKHRTPERLSLKREVRRTDYAALCGRASATMRRLDSPAIVAGIARPFWPATGIARLRRAAKRPRAAQQMLHRMIVFGHDLPAQPRRHVDHQRRFEIQRERIADLIDDRQHLGVARFGQAQRLDVAPSDADAIVGDEPPRADHRQRHVRPVEALQPAQARNSARRPTAPSGGSLPCRSARRRTSARPLRRSSPCRSESSQCPWQVVAQGLSELAVGAVLATDSIAHATLRPFLDRTMRNSHASESRLREPAAALRARMLARIESAC